MGLTIVQSASFTRPADTTAYTSGDVVGNSTTPSAVAPLEFAGMVRAAIHSGILYGVEMDDQNNAPTPGEFELWLFKASLTVGADNVPAQASWNDSANLLAVVPLYTSYLLNQNAGGAGIRRYQSGFLGIPYTAAANGSLYGILVARSAYTPIASEAFRITLRAEIDWR